jgi:hypothetical protein
MALLPYLPFEIPPLFHECPHHTHTEQFADRGRSGACNKGHGVLSDETPAKKERKGNPMPTKSHSIRSRLVLAALCGAAVTGSVLAPSAQADEWNKKTVVTIDQPIQITKTVLAPGQYVFKLLNSSSDRHIVQIFNTRENHVYATILAIPNYRLEPEGHSQFRFYETPAGRVKALRAWFYPGDNYGQEFPYPKHLEMAAVTNTTTASAETTTTTQSSTADRSTEDTVTQAETQPMTETPPPVVQQEQQPVETAENTPPPVPEPPPAPTPAPALPKTATFYPLIGLSGLLLLGVRGLLRRQHS